MSDAELANRLDERAEAMEREGFITTARYLREAAERLRERALTES